MLGALLAGCSGSGGDEVTADQEQPEQPAPAGMLRLADPAELEAAIERAFTQPRTASRNRDIVALAPSDAAAFASAPFTGTYTQEAKVDEFDAVRYDGEHLYVAPQRYLTCCFIQQPAPGAVAPSPKPSRAIRILATSPESASAAEAGEIPLPDDVSVQGMYLANGRMFALTSESYFGTYGPFWADAAIAIWAPERHGFKLYDTTDVASPKLLAEADIDGVFVESRRVGNTVYIVSRYSPVIDGLKHYVENDADAAHNADLLRDVGLDRLLPRITLNGVSRPLVDAQRCYVATDADERGYAVVTTIVAVPIGNPSAVRAVCYDEGAYGVYVSPSAIYLTELRPDFAAQRAFTRIHKFALETLAYEGSGEVPGQVWHGGQADFRMSEHDGDLRMFTSEFDWNSDDVVDHRLFVLRKSSAGPKLEIVAQLPNAARPAEIGKPNEQLYGVRFLADRAYAVTFERIDPLYVIDLSDPKDPYVAGQLEVAGVSDFLHPVTDDLLLGLGMAETGGIKLELFDVSDLARPLSRGSVTLGGRASSSDALYDRHAFTYQADVGGVDRIAVPATLYSEDGAYRFEESGLYFFEIRDKNDVQFSSLRRVGGLVTNKGGEPRFASRNRSFIHGDAVYYVRDEEIWAGLWTIQGPPNGPF